MTSHQPSPSRPRRVVIVGAGLFGLAAAKTYLEVNPNIDLTILDSESSVGGTWSSSRVYPELTADSPVPTFEFGEMSMIDEFEVRMWSDISGKMVAQYLNRYARKFRIVERCRFNTDVLKVQRNGKAWKVWIQWMDLDQPKIEILDCDILILATGMTSKPCTPKCNETLARTESVLRPCFPTMDVSKYQGPVIHTKELNDCSAILKNPHVKHVTVVGGNKSAAEAVSTCVSAGKIVNWVIRENGSGPGMLVNAKITGKHGAEIGNCKLGTLFMPSIHGKRGWWYYFLQSGKNPLGSLIFKLFWALLTKLAVGNRYERSRNGNLLKPDVCNIFWLTSGLSIAHDNDQTFMDVVNEGKLVHVFRASILTMNEDTISLSNKTTIASDATIFATGWHPGINSLFGVSLAAELGLPVPVCQRPKESAQYWSILNAAADQKVLDMYPLLASPPKEVKVREQPLTPLTMFRNIIPPSLAARQDRSIAFLGNLYNSQNTTLAEVSALWSVAYLEGLMPDNELLGNKMKMDQDIALTNAFMLRRYPGRKNEPIAMMEVKDWTDLMLRELGLRTDRKRVVMEKSGEYKRSSWLGFELKVLRKDWFEPCVPADYKGIVQEFLARVGGEKVAKGW